MALVETSDRAGLAVLADLSDERFEILHAALRAASPGEGEKNIAARLSQVLDLPENMSHEIVSSVMALFTYNVRDADVPRFVDDVLKEMGSGDIKTRIAPEKSTAFKQRVTRILNIEPIRLRSKARALLFEAPQLFQSARIMTDLRPVFGTAELHVSGAIVKHDLKIEFVDREGYKQFFVTMDDADIRSLKLTLERAERKAHLLRSLLENFQISDLNPGELDTNA